MRIALLTAIAALFTMANVSAEAMPVSTLKGVTNSDQTITQVRQGCGRGWHRGRYGRCRRN